MVELMVYIWMFELFSLVYKSGKNLMVSAVDKLPTVIACPYTASQYIILAPNTRRIFEEMKFNEKLLSIRKKKGLSQEQLGMELQVSRQTISKWEAGQSYPDFQRLVMLSDYFDMTLDELVKDIDVQDVREKSLTDEKVNSIYLDVENGKAKVKKLVKILCYIILLIGVFVVAGSILHLVFPDIEWLWQRM